MPIDFKSNCINYDVRIYGFDFGYDQHVVNLAPGQSYHMKSHLGQVFFALSPQNIYLGLSLIALEFILITRKFYCSLG